MSQKELQPDSILLADICSKAIIFEDNKSCLSRRCSLSKKQEVTQAYASPLRLVLSGSSKGLSLFH